MKSEQQINDLLDRAVDRCYQPSKFRSMTYEEGVRATLEWVLEDSEEEDPLE